MASTTEAPKPPKPDEFELSLFGPGVGESVVVHLGNGAWIVVDSCRDRATRKPVALEYLDALGVDVASAVKLVVVTHWHDDHIGGAADVLARAENARFVCSGALGQKPFLEQVARCRRMISTQHPSGLTEFSDILNLLEARRPKGVRQPTSGPEWARANTVLLRQEEPWETLVEALSPSSAAITRSFHDIAGLIPVIGESRGRAVVRPGPNESSVVLWVRVSGVKVLLGADLEETGTPLLGWSAIVASEQRPPGRAHGFKVAHHGSENADHAGIWTDMLVDKDPCAVITPYASGVTPRPAPGDVARIAGRTGEVYCTAPPRGWAPPKRTGPVERTLRETARTHRAINKEMGHIRVRMSLASAPAGEPTIDLFGAALSLT